MRCVVLGAAVAVLFASCSAHAACDPTFVSALGEVIHVIRGLPPGTCRIDYQETIPAAPCSSLKMRAELAREWVSNVKRYRKKHHIDPSIPVLHLVCLVWDPAREDWVDGPNYRP